MFNRLFRSKLSKTFSRTAAELDAYVATPQTLPLQGFAGRVVQPTQPESSITVLDNGITVVSQTPTLGGAINLQVLLNVGTSDETHQTSGSLLSIKNTYYKTVLITNEAVNYGMVQMTGGQFTMNYDQESALFSAQCLPHDVYDILSMTCDCAVEPRSAVAAGIGIRANKNSQGLEKIVDSGLDFNDLVSRTAYGIRGLGMPLLGLEANIENLNVHTLQRFQMENITPNRIFIGGSNVENHDELVDLVQEKFAFMPALDVEEEFARDVTEYKGGEFRKENNSNRADIAVLFPTGGWASSQATALQLASVILGEYDSFSAEVGQTSQINASRSYQQVGTQHAYVDAIQSLNFVFDQQGLFGVRVSGASAQAQSLFDIARDQLFGLSSVTQQELDVAKAALRRRVLQGLETDEAQLEESLKNLRTFGRICHGEYVDWIEAVTVEDVQNAVDALLRETPTVVIQGGEVAQLKTAL